MIKDKKKAFKILQPLFVVVIVVAVLFLGGRESKVTLVEDSIRIGGMYKINIAGDEMQDISLIESMPKVGRKINGMEIFNIKKGNFRMEEIERGRLYLHSADGPYIQITTNKDVIFINFRNSEKTERIYNEIKGIK